MINSLVTNNWITVTFIIMIGLLVVVNYFFEKRFLSFRKLFNTKQYFVEYISITSVFHPFNVIFLIFQVFCFSILVLKILLYFKYELPANQLLLFFKLVFGILTFYLFRYFLGKIFAVIFKLKKEQSGLSFVKSSELSKVALLIFPFLVLFHYFEFKNGVLFAVLAIYATCLLLVKYVIILVQNQKLIFSRLFYFILYLCILEILPLMLVFNTLIDEFKYKV